MNSKAVSPVIGVILMVAITVILAAVIAAFVFNMSGQIQNYDTQNATPYQGSVYQKAIIIDSVSDTEIKAMDGSTYSIEIANFDYHTHFRGEHVLLSYHDFNKVIGISRIP